MIASGLSIGIGKRELMEDYYLEEISDVVGEWNRLHNPEHEEIVEMKPEEFLGGGGEWLD